jgi:uncharacterized surface protein with fasciclin (FAS1) repeats
MTRIIYAFLLCFSLGIASTQTVVDIVVDSPDHNTLETAVIAAGLDGTLSGSGPFTLFAPTDDAFAALPDGVLMDLLNDPSGALTDILLYHTLSGTFLSSDLSDGQILTTIEGRDITITINTDGVFINNAQVTVANLVADNGVVHVIDAVLLPPRTTVVDVVVNSDVHNTLETAVIAADLAGTLSGDGPFTLFAPTDAAFAALPDGVLGDLLADPTGALTDVLLYHAVNGQALSGDLSDGQMITTINGKDVTVTIDASGIFINDAQVTLADITTDNGVVHVLDAVLIPPTVTVVDIVVNSDVHTTLETAVLAADLAGTLSGDGPFTLFAPTDDAFAALPAGVLDDLLADPTGALTDVLLYHAVSGEALSTDLMDGQMITTINGKDVTVTIDANGVFINDAQVTLADIQTDNGVVHVLDAVLVPPTVTIVDVVVNSDVHNTLETAVIAAGLAGTLSGEGPFTLFAPTDAAFAALPAGVLDDLLADPTGALTDVLLYHAVNGTALSSDLSDGQVISTILGQDITVTIDTNGVFINDAQVILADIQTDNGVVHVIDAVLTIPTTTIVDIVVNSDVHNTLETAVIAAGLAGTLSGPGPFTLFAPTDAAFAALPDGALDDLLADPTGALTDVLLYHAVNGVARSTDLTDGQMVMTINGKNVTVTIDTNGVFINNAQVTLADIQTDNGVVHVIDAVLLPPRTTIVDVVVNSDIHNTLETAVIAAGLAGTLSGDGPFTLFAPTDDAFAALPDGTLTDLLNDPSGALTDILLYHAVNGQALSTDLTNGQTIQTINGKNVTVTIDTNGVFINNAQVTLADIQTDNGVVHVIDAVLLPPRVTVVDVVVNSDVHNTLETAVLAAGLAGTLSSEGPFTLFAPTDAAFAALPEGTLDDLLADPAGALTQVLLYHAVSGTALSSDLSDGQSIMTINGQDVMVRIDTNGVFINDAQVIIADITTDNGVVHVIDAVLVPTTTSTRNVFNTEVTMMVNPNPFDNQVEIEFTEVKTGTVFLSLFNAMGEQVRNWTYNLSNKTLDTSQLASGMYFLVSENEGLKEVKKLVKN